MQKCKQQNWRAYGKSIHLCCVHWRLDWTCFLNVNLVLCAKWKKTRLSSSSLRQSWWSWSAEVAGYSAPWSSWPDHVTAGPNIPKSIQEQGWSTLSNWTVTILPTNVLALLACLAPLGRGPSNFVMSYEAVPMQKSGPPHEWLLHALISTHGTPGGSLLRNTIDMIAVAVSVEIAERGSLTTTSQFQICRFLDISWIMMYACTRASLVQLRSAFQLD